MLRRGETMAQWARRHGFNPADVRNVLAGKAKGHWGESHKIAVMLGMKEGEIIEDECNTFPDKGVAQAVASEGTATPYARH